MADKDQENKIEEVTKEAEQPKEVVEKEVVEAVVEEPVEEQVDFRVGDSIRVFYKIIEGEKSRVQPFEGIVIAIKGKELSKTFTVRKIGAGQIGVERIFPFQSPNIDKIEVTKYGNVRRSKLYYLRDKIGKAATKIKERKV